MINRTFIWAWLLVFSIQVELSCYAQTNAIWGQSYEQLPQELVSNYSSSLKCENKNNNTAFVDYNALLESYASNSGKLLVKRVYGSLQDNLGNTIKGSDSLMYSAYYSSTSGIFLRTKSDELTYINVFSEKTNFRDSTDGGWNYAVLNLISNNGKPEVYKDKRNITIVPPSRRHVDQRHMLGASRIGIHTYRLFILEDGALHVFKVDSSGVVLLDKKVIDFYPELHSTSSSIIQKNYQLVVSNIGNFVIVNENYIKSNFYPNGANHISKEVENGNRMFKIYFDVKNKVLDLQKNILLDSSKYLYPYPLQEQKWEFSKPFLVGNCISLNDSFVYFKKESYMYSRINAYSSKFESSQEYLVQLDLNRGVKVILDSNIFNSTSSLKLNAKGEIIFALSERRDAIICKIKKPNKPSPFCEYVRNDDKFINKNIYGNFPLHVSDNLQFKIDISIDCQALVKFNNLSGAYFEIDTFYWWVQNDQGGIDSFMAKDTALSYTKDGDYPFRVQGTTEKGNGFGEAYYDTIKIRIPKRPVANFNTRDSVVCRYLPVYFEDLSVAQDTNPNGHQEWIWDFGDGSAPLVYKSKKEVVSYEYQNPGVYTVSLTYKNGYCDSTIIKKDFIKIVDAPKAGFTVKDTQGCTPFTAQFIDTTWHNVQSKEYFFSDSNKWVPVTQDNFNHLFAKSGTFRAVQRLHGYTGCVITTDSVFVHVSKGILPTDTAHVKNATFVNNDLVKINWSVIDAAVEYKLFRDNKEIFTTTQNTYFDTLPILKEYKYKVVAYDSCGTASQDGNIGKPIFLTGRVGEGNKFSVIYYTPYEKWNNTEIEYTILSLRDGIESVENSNLPADSFIDNNFLELDAIEKCYKIRGRGVQNGLITESNTICLPYIPTVFIPDAFTPNNDGLNDGFKPRTIGIKTYTFKVFNSWGEQIFSSEENGTWLPDYSVPIGVYLYTIEMKNNLDERMYDSGTITLLR